jgi:hypothetical protein
MSITSAEIGEPHETAHETETAPSSDPHHAEETAPPVLITEQKVLFGSAASIAVPPAGTRRRLNPVQLATTALRQLFASQPRPAKVHYPPRSRSYYDTSLGGRERFRL